MKNARFGDTDGIGDALGHLDGGVAVFGADCGVAAGAKGIQK